MSLADDFFASRPDKELRSVDIEREDGKVFTFYFEPLTFRDLSKLQKKHPNFLNEQTADGMIDLVIMKALDASGNKVFDHGHKFKLMGEQFEVIPKMFGAIFDSASEEEQEKN